jgi:hypothetical protein
MSRLLTLAILLAAATAIAKPRIAVMPFTGPKASKVKLQVTKKLCAKYTCITPKKGTPASVDAVVVGTVTKKDVELKVYIDEDTEPVTLSLKLGAGGKINPRILAKAPSVVKDALANVEEDTGDEEGGVSGAQP